MTKALRPANLSSAAMRILAIDHGEKRAGLAVSDETGTIALPLKFLPAQPPAELLAHLARTVVERNVEAIVVGLPRNMDGSYGPAAERARGFAAALRQAVAVPVTMWDERLTSAQANRFLIEAGLRREKRKERVDQTAAAILLQSYLDHAGQ